MADRKISELNLGTRVFDEDYMVVVTGINQYIDPADPSQGFKQIVTSKVPLSGMAAWTFRVNEMVSGCTGIQIIPHVNTGLTPARMNTIEICATGLALEDHTHVASEITNFNSAVSGLVHQDIKFLDTAYVTTGTTNDITELSVDLVPNARYLCQVGIIVSGTSTSTEFSAKITSTGIDASNGNLLNVYGTWPYQEPVNRISYSTSIPVTGAGAGNAGMALVGSGINNGSMTIVANFTAKTYATESDRLGVRWSVNGADGAVLPGSWFKAEKVI